MSARNYSSVAQLASLTAGVSDSATTLPVDQTTGFPTAPFTLVIDPGRAAEEIVTVTVVAGLNLTVVRGQDGSSAQAHSAAAAVRHMATARDYQESGNHVAASTGVHGITGAVVGTTDTQGLDNKTFIAVSTDHVPVKLQAAGAQTANLLDVLSVGAAVLASIKVDGRVLTPGVDGTNTSTFTAGNASTVPLIIKGAVSQAVNLLSIRDSGGNEKISANAAGTLFATTLNAATVNASSSVNSPNVNGTTQSIFASGLVGTTPLIADNPGGQSAAGFAVRDDTAALRAGVTGETTGYQLFHGNSANKVPFKIHGGVDSVVMTTGATSIGGSVDISSYGYAAAPIVALTVRQENVSATQRRVAVTIETAPTAALIKYRVHQTSADVMPSDTTYLVHWMAFQMAPTVAAG